MTATAAPGDVEAIRQALQGITAAWREGRTEDLDGFFHEDIVTVLPGCQVRVAGRGPCVQSYRDFLNSATVRDYREAEPAIDVWGDTAVTTCRWEMAWETNGQSHREAGHELFVFTRAAGRWLAVWRTLIPLPGQV
jgi:ketosteroid isomerase-like protein